MRTTEQICREEKVFDWDCRSKYYERRQCREMPLKLSRFCKKSSRNEKKRKVENQPHWEAPGSKLIDTKKLRYEVLAAGLSPFELVRVSPIGLSAIQYLGTINNHGSHKFVIAKYTSALSPTLNVLHKQIKVSQNHTTAGQQPLRSPFE